MIGIMNTSAIAFIPGMPRRDNAIAADDHHPFAVAAGVALLAVYFHRLETFVAYDASALRPRPAAWGSVRMGEAADRAEVGRRVGASVLIVGGALLLAFGG